VRVVVGDDLQACRDKDKPLIGLYIGAMVEYAEIECPHLVVW
jgi:hypothetical protein